MEQTTTRIFFTDLDGTLLNDQKKITPENYDCIQKLIRRGHIVVICTGRALSSAIRQAEKLHLTMEGCYIIAFNGSIIYDVYHRKTVYQADLPIPYAQYLIRKAKEKGIHVQAYDDQHVIAETENPALQRYASSTNMEYRVLPSLAEHLSWQSPKLLLIDYENRQPLLDFGEEISTWATGKVDYYFSCAYYLEIVPPAVSKGNAVRKLCDLLNIPIDNTVSAGDAENDLSMLEATAESIVMRNAIPDLFSYATYITEADNNHSGVAEALTKIFEL